MHKKISDDFIREIQGFYKVNDGFVNTKTNMKILFYAAFSEGDILQSQQIAPFRTLKNSLFKLLDTLDTSFQSGALENLPRFSKMMGEDKELLRELNYISIEDVISPWNYFPRHLSKAEYLDPSSFFKKFFEYKNVIDWKDLFHELFSSGLLHQSIINFSDLIDNAILIHDYSFKLLDITHLVILRHASRKQ